MTRFDRQERIPDWDQERLAQAVVAVCGKGWLGAFTVWALSSLGVGRIVWLGEECDATRAMTDWLAAPSRFPDVVILDQPSRVESPDEIAWLLSGFHPKVMLGCSEDADEQEAYGIFARENDVAWFAAIAGGGGWFGSGDLPQARDDADPVIALVLAALLADAARESLCPLFGGTTPSDGWLGLERTPAGFVGLAMLIGVGGIGVYAATALAARGCGMLLLDHDTVDVSNLNRQGLYTIDDAAESLAKATAAQRALARWFPDVTVSAEVCRVDADYFKRQRNEVPAVLLSAVDNARTRLVLQSLGRQLSVPVIQGGTSLFAADCFTQGRTGPLLDEQMHGALTEAAQREVERDRRGGCAADPSYVVPGMLAGALLAYRCLHAATWQDVALPPPPLCWRTGFLPIEQRKAGEGFDFDQLTLETI